MRVEAKTRRMSLRTPERVRTREEVLPIWEGVVVSVDCWGICGGLASNLVEWGMGTYEEDAGDVESKGDHCVCE